MRIGTLITKLLERYGKMTKGAIISHIDDWNFDEDGEKLFNEILKKGLIEKSNEPRMYQLTKKNKEAFDPVKNAWPVGVQNPDHGCDCQMGKDNSTMYSSKGPTIFKQATPDFTPEESSIGTGKQNPDDTDRNITLRASQAFSDNQEDVHTEDVSNIASKGIPISPLWKEKHDAIADDTSDDRNITFKIELVHEPEEFNFEEDIIEWKEAEIPRKNDKPKKRKRNILLGFLLGSVKYIPKDLQIKTEFNDEVYTYEEFTQKDFDEVQELLSKIKSSSDKITEFIKKGSEPELTTIINEELSTTEKIISTGDIPREDEFTEPSVVVGTVKYFPEDQTMLVELNGKQYPYYGVAYKDFNSFKGASSKGAAYNRMFKGQTKYFTKDSSALNQEAIQHSKSMKESILANNPASFPWVSEDSLKQMLVQGQKGEGKYLLLEAAKPQVTDHRVEGEQYKRLINTNVLKKLTYTAIRKGSDINHNLEKKDFNSGVVVDAEYNDNTDTAEFEVYESDPEILQGIRDGFIDAVSINGGQARTYKIIGKDGVEVDNEVRCATGECFRLGEGIILGEKDDIAFTWVVTKPGFIYNGKPIPFTEPGIKSTTIRILE